MDLQAVIITSIVGLVSAIVSSGIWSLLAQRKVTAAKVITEEETAKKVKAETDKIRSEAAQIIQDSSGDLVMEYKKQLQEVKDERTKDKTKFEKELFNIKKQLNERINKLEEELNEAYIEIDRQRLVINDLTKRIVELSK